MNSLYRPLHSMPCHATVWMTYYRLLCVYTSCEYNVSLLQFRLYSFHSQSLRSAFGLTFCCACLFYMYISCFWCGHIWSNRSWLSRYLSLGIHVVATNAPISQNQPSTTGFHFRCSILLYTFIYLFINRRIYRNTSF